MRRRAWLVTVLTAAPVATQQNNLDNEPFQAQLRPVLSQYCFKCHGARKQKNGINLEAVQSSRDVVHDYRLWRRVIEAVESGAMPPAERRQPAQQERTTVVRVARDILRRGGERVDPGRGTLRRLNRRQYERTVRDLLFGYPVQVADHMPKDPQGYGFDTVGDVLFATPLLIEKYFDVTQAVLDEFAEQEERLAQLITSTPQGEKSVTAAAIEILRPFMDRAFRRPATEPELDARVSLVKAEVGRGASYESAILTAVKSVLLAPQFLFRIEADRDSDSPWSIDNYELATRLSYFLWSTMPDAVLLELAARGKLVEADVLRSQIKRMLDDPRSRALADDFAAQWLGYREVLDHAADVRRFNTFRQRLRDDLYEESARFFDDLVRNDKPITLLLDADYAFLNQRVATHYGIGDVKGDEFRKVDLQDRRRGGVIGMASMLAVTSYPLRTSPVQRGKWILETLLGDPPPPPPPGAGVLPPDDKSKDKLTLRQQLERHRKDPKCASCHAKMDPLGLALEAYDGIGRWRSENHGRPIDTLTTMSDGQKVDGPIALKDWLKTREQVFLGTAIRKLMIYGLGRDLALPDEKIVDSIAVRVKHENGSTRAMIEAVVMSYPFRHRRSPR